MHAFTMPHHNSAASFCGENVAIPAVGKFARKVLLSKSTQLYYDSIDLLLPDLMTWPLVIRIKML
jgi:hypothetical protein